MYIVEVFVFDENSLLFKPYTIAYTQSDSELIELINSVRNQFGYKYMLRITKEKEAFSEEKKEKEVVVV